MSRKVSTLALSVLTLSALALDAVLTGPLAVAEGDVTTELGELGIVPEQAYLTEKEPNQAVVDGLDVRLVESGATYTLQISNPTQETRELDLAMDLEEMRGSMMSRMGPVTQHLATERLHVRIPPGGHLTQTVGARAFKPAQLETIEMDGELVPTEYLTRSVRLRRGEGEGAQILAELFASVPGQEG